MNGQADQRGMGIQERLRQDPAPAPSDPWDDGCVACGAEVLNESDRPFMLPEVAKAGHDVALCDACAYMFHHEQAQKRLARILTVVVDRTIAGEGESLNPRPHRSPA